MQRQCTLELSSRGPELSVQGLKDLLFLGTGANGFPPPVQGEGSQNAGHDHQALNQQTY
jgi:hypothetical protein